MLSLEMKNLGLRQRYATVQGISKKLNRFEIALNSAKQRLVSCFLYI
jgi:hypothetical protein